ncbi:MAG: Uma2 family endonuclease [Ignavibacteriales bacterium]|nr:Uma2 family endonuclease [Ignavibacteriales bacterium]
MQVDKDKFYTVEEYLEHERNAESRSEYQKGRLFALAGASFKHNLICGNIFAKLHPILRKKKCNVLQSDLKVYIKEHDLFTYPDIIIVCGEPKFADKNTDTLVNPVVIFEVLSKSTEAYDRGMKFSFYRKLDSLKEYILIAQDRISVVHFIKSEPNDWNLREYDSLENNFLIPSVDCRLKLSDVYNKIKFDEEPYGLQILREASEEYSSRHFIK